jgi:hypothetical protein
MDVATVFSFVIPNLCAFAATRLPLLNFVASAAVLRAACALILFDL